MPTEKEKCRGVPPAAPFFGVQHLGARNVTRLPASDLAHRF